MICDPVFHKVLSDAFTEWLKQKSIYQLKADRQAMHFGSRIMLHNQTVQH